MMWNTSSTRARRNGYCWRKKKTVLIFVAFLILLYIVVTTYLLGVGIFWNKCPKRIFVYKHEFVWQSPFPPWAVLNSTKIAVLQLSEPQRPMIDERLLESMRSNSALGYQREGQGDFSGILNQTSGYFRSATFTDVWVDTQGIIIDAQRCEKRRVNGGCIRKEAVFETPLLSETEVESYDHVVTIAQLWGEAVWHFVMEAMVGLAALTPEQRSKGKLHVTKITPFALEWLRLVGITEERLISGTIHARQLVVPELGGCGAPKPWQIEWLKSIVNKAAPLPNPNSLDAAVLVKRTKSRQLNNYDQLEIEVQSFAEANGLTLIVHDDSDLPSVPRQLEAFARAAVVIAPHGAAEINLIASSNKTTVIEFMDPENLNLCFTRLSSGLMGQDYHALVVQNGEADLEGLAILLGEIEMNL